ncbi:MAG: hypothetical protein D6800_03185 [Candidatus Zixiibacteriota bacterium]|nr:MAG: hypothetical protein D6800_03185 [candidate division Zixibacteria bacterium]
MRITIKGDFRGQDIELLQAYIEQIVREMTGAPVSRVITHGMVVPRLDQVRQTFQERVNADRQ